jgi:two-component sensor histidine kinase
MVELVVLCCCIVCCNSPKTEPKVAKDFWRTLQIADSIYALKSGPSSFKEVVPYYDSAYAIAIASNDDLMKANASLAMGRMYDAYGKDYESTFKHFNDAASAYSRLKKSNSYFFSKSLALAALGKLKDSTRICSEITKLSSELKQQRKIYTNLYALLAQISAENNNMPLAYQILQLSDYNKVYNEGVLYKNKYIEAAAILENKGYKLAYGPFGPKLADFLKDSNCKTVDSLELSLKLYQYYLRIKNYEKAVYYNELNEQISKRVNFDKENLDYRVLLQESTLKFEKQQIQLLSRTQRIQTIAISLLAVLLLAALYILFLVRKNRKKDLELQDLFKSKADEAQTLMKEMQHRVKNNVFMMQSLLKMNERTANTDYAKQLLRILHSRVETIALLHDTLYNQPTINNISTYFKQLVAKTVASNVSLQAVNTTLNIESAALQANLGLPLSLIINEWILNSLKYAQAPDNNIHLTLEAKQKDGILTITYFDNGKVQESKASEGQGTNIIKLLTSQIKGKLIRQEQNPFHYTLEVPNNDRV